MRAVFPVIPVLFLALSGPARADDAPAPAAPAVAAPAPAPVEAPPPKPIGLVLDMGFRTAYLFRGNNVFGDKQLDPHGLFEPSVVWTIPGTALSVGWWGGFQTNGGNVQAKLDRALGGEQDLWFNYDVALPASLTLSLGTQAYVYPMASGLPANAGTSCPWYLEPRVGLAWAGPVTLSVNVMYFLGLQDTPAVRGSSYLYLNPKIARTFTLLPFMNLDLALSYGFKEFIDGNAGHANIHDVLFKASVTFRPYGKLYVTPGFGAAWTNLPGRSAGDEFAVFGSVNVGVEL
jgi:hypothetical protein